MRYLGWTVLLILMVGSWATIHRAPDISEGVHWGLQRELKNAIVNKLGAADLKKIDFKYLWTENLEDRRVKATFHYTYENGSGDESDMKGYAILQSPQGGDSPWKVIQVHILREGIVFKEGLHLEPGGALDTRSPSLPNDAPIGEEAETGEDNEEPLEESPTEEESSL